MSGSHEDLPAPQPASAATAKVAPVRKAWGDEDFDECDFSSPVLDLSSLSISAPNLSAQVAELDAPENEIKKIVADDALYTSATTFEELNLSEPLLTGLYAEMKFEKPSRIQAVTLPMILTPPYQNLIAQAHNGSGKTTCFVLGMLSRVDPQLHAPQALCVCPTRELAIQNQQVVTKMGRHTGISSACTAFADAGRPSRITEQVVIGTPGTLKRWMTKDKVLSAKTIRVLVFDEADHMLAQDGFQDDSVRIMKEITKEVTKIGGSLQVLLFSATFDDTVKQFAQRITVRANYVFVEKEKLSLDVIKQYRVKCASTAAKIQVLKDRIFPAAEKLGQSIIFVATRKNALDLHSILNSDGHKCTSIQGSLTHEERDRVIQEFRSGQTKILIATDVLARGFDQAQVTLVVNFDVPVKQTPPRHPDYELYLHRIGRSGRFGRRGAAFNLLVTEQDERVLDSIERHFNRHIPEVGWNDDDAFEKVLREAGLA